MSVTPKIMIRSVRDIRTYSDKVNTSTLPYKVYMRISCLEMEKARRLKEREGAVERVHKLDSRIKALDEERGKLQEAINLKAAVNQEVTAQARVAVRMARGKGSYRERAVCSPKEGFKIRY